MKQLILVGFMGAGKTTIGKALAARWQLDFVDLDEALVNQLGMNVADYFAEFGEEAFRQQESQLLKEVVGRPGILATGGGVVLKAANRQLLQATGNVVYLAVAPEVALRRIEQGQRAIRPLARNKSVTDLATLLQGRLSLYEEVAQWVIDTSEMTQGEVVQQILKLRQE